MKAKIAILVICAMLMVPGILVGRAAAGDNNLYEVTITNLTRDQIFSPPLAVSHNEKFDLFVPGDPASPELTALAEEGDTGPFTTLIEGLPSVKDYAVAPGPVMPGASTTLKVQSRGDYRLISVAGMLVTTNDGFFAARNMPAFPWKGYATDANAYDAGSEANSESCAYIPGPPCDSHNVRDTDGAEGYVHIHAGIHGIGDLDASQWDWRNPVARITIRKMK